MVRLHRAVAYPLVFATVDLQFRRLYNGNTNVSSLNPAWTILDRQKSKSSEEILQKIAADDELSSCIKVLKVRGLFRATPELEGTLTIQIGLLIWRLFHCLGVLLKGLNNLERLRTLYLSHTDLTPRMLDAFVKALQNVEFLAFG